MDTPKHTPWEDMAYQGNKTQLHLPEARNQPNTRKQNKKKIKKSTKI